ncbi:hypothetical protein ACRAWD_12980 [Caulobacter segnis]
MTALARRNRSAGEGAFFCRAGALSPPRAGHGRPHHPAVGVPDQATRPTSRRSPRAPCRSCSEFQTQVAALTGMRGGQRLALRRARPARPRP